MCEYANNLADMGILFYSIEDKRKIVYDEEKYAADLFSISIFQPSIYIAFHMLPYTYMILVMKFNNITFARVSDIYLQFFIRYSLW
jgi:hypothetical protein